MFIQIVKSVVQYVQVEEGAHKAGLEAYRQALRSGANMERAEQAREDAKTRARRLVKATFPIKSLEKLERLYGVKEPGRFYDEPERENSVWVSVRVLCSLISQKQSLDHRASWFTQKGREFSKAIIERDLELLKVLRKERDKLESSGILTNQPVRVSSFMSQDAEISDVLGNGSHTYKKKTAIRQIFFSSTDVFFYISKEQLVERATDIAKYIFLHEVAHVVHYFESQKPKEMRMRLLDALTIDDETAERIIQEWPEALSPEEENVLLNEMWADAWSLLYFRREYGREGPKQDSFTIDTIVYRGRANHKDSDPLHDTREVIRIMDKWTDEQLKELSDQNLMDIAKRAAQLALLQHLMKKTEKLFCDSLWGYVQQAISGLVRESPILFDAPVTKLKL
jgi:hypothetical protein